MSPKPWKLETCGQLLAGMVVCGFMGATVVALTGYDPIGARASWWVVRLTASGGLACLAVALGLALGRWRDETFSARLIGLAATTFLGMSLASTTLHLSGAAGNPQPSLRQIIVSTIFFQVAWIGLITWLLRRGGDTWTGMFGLRRAPLPAALRGLALALVALPTGWLLQAGCAQVLRALHLEPQEQTLVETLRLLQHWPAKVYLGMTALVVAPISEEAIFRGILYPTLKRSGFPRLALWSSALLFGAIHFNAASFVPLTLLAAANALLYDRTRNLLAPIATHVVFNAGNLVALLVLQHLAAHAP